MKYVILHAGGMADHPRQELEGLTPLRAAQTPHLDCLAQSGELGVLVFPAETDRPGTGLSGTAILGYDRGSHFGSRRGKSLRGERRSRGCRA